MVPLWIVVLQLGAGVVAVAAAAAAFRHRDKPAGVPVVAIALAGAGWAFSAGLQPLTANLAASKALEMSQYLMADVVALSWLYIAVEYAERSWFQQRHVLAVPIGVVVVSFLATVTNPLHGLVLEPATTVNADGTINEVQGLLYWPKIVWDYCIILLGMGILVVEVRNRTGTYRIQALAVLVSGIIPSIAAFVAALKLLDIPGFTPSTVGISISGVVLLWALFSADFLEVAPVARRTLVENMDDAVIALDTENRVIDINERAKALLDIEGDPVGEHGKAVFGAYPELVSEFDDQLSADTDVAVTQDGETRYYHIKISPVYSDSPGTLMSPAEKTLLGRSIVVRDITERRRREEDLSLLKQVLTRALRHNIRNDLSVVRNYAELLEQRTNGTHADLTRELLTATDDIVDLSEKARRVEELVDAPRARVTVDATEIVRNAVQSVAAEYPDATIETSLPETAEVRANQRLDLAVENILENAVEHTIPPATVSVEVERAESTVAIVIADSGPGIPAQETAVLEAQAETDLQHGSGLGLWIVNWVVDRSHGTLEFENSDGGCRVTLELDRA